MLKLIQSMSLPTMLFLLFYHIIPVFLPSCKTLQVEMEEVTIPGLNEKDLFM